MQIDCYQLATITSNKSTSGMLNSSLFLEKRGFMCSHTDESKDPLLSIFVLVMFCFCL